MSFDWTLGGMKDVAVGCAGGCFTPFNLNDTACWLELSSAPWPFAPPDACARPFGFATARAAGGDAGGGSAGGSGWLGAGSDGAGGAAGDSRARGPRGGGRPDMATVLVLAVQVRVQLVLRYKLSSSSPHTSPPTPTPATVR